MTKLTSIPYLAALPDEERLRLEALSVERAIAAGQTLFVEGDTAEGIFLILSGAVRISRTTAGGREQVLHEEGPGATLAEVPVFDGRGCVGTAIATTAATVLLVPKAALLDAVARNPSAAARIVSILAARVRRFATLAADLSLQSVDARVARDLIERAAGGTEIELPATRELWASQLGTVREQVSRALSRLQKRGAIRVAGRRVSILDRSVVMQIAEP